MDLRLYILRAEDMGDHSVFIHQICGAYDTYGATPACHFLSPAAKLLKQSCLGVGNQRERQVVGVGKLTLGRNLVFTYSNDTVAGVGKFLFMLLK